MGKVTSQHILRALRQKYFNAAIVREVEILDPYEQGIRALNHAQTSPRWDERTLKLAKDEGYFIPESVPVGWNYVDSVIIRRIDALLFETNMLTAIEIKVSRSDFFRDTEEKRRAWRAHTDRFIYSTPKGLVTLDEVPKGCGLVEYDPEKFNPRYTNGHALTTVRNATKNKNKLELPNKVFKNMAYRVSNYEKKYEKTQLPDN